MASLIIVVMSKLPVCDRCTSRVVGREKGSRRKKGKGQIER